MVNLDALIAAWKPADGPLQLHAGDYLLKESSIPLFRNQSGIPTKKLDFKLFGAGEDKTRIVSYGSQDILNFNNVSGVELNGFTIEHGAPDSGYGVNGISLTNGCCDFCIQNVDIQNLPLQIPDRVSIVDGKEQRTPSDHYNGGKAITVQPGRAHSYNIGISWCRAINCPIGFGSDVVAGQNCILDIDQCGVQECDLALSLSCSGETQNEQMTCLVQNLDVRNTNRLMLNGRFSKTWLNNVSYREQVRVCSDARNRFWEKSPFRVHFGEDRLVCKPGREVDLNNVVVVTDTLPWNYHLGAAVTDGFWIRESR